MGSLIGPKGEILSEPYFILLLTELASGMDPIIVEIVDTLLEKAKIPHKVKTGPVPYTTEESLAFEAGRLPKTKEKYQSPMTA
jgi:hypothetical protein